jgi:hypothetical protein
MKTKLIKANVVRLGLPEGKSDAIHFDTEIPGFGLRFRQGAEGIIVTWVLQHKRGRETLGRYPAIRPEQAREWAAKEYARIALGHDPAAEREAARRQAAETLEPALRLYMAPRRCGRARVLNSSGTPSRIVRPCIPSPSPKSPAAMSPIA